MGADFDPVVRWELAVEASDSALWWIFGRNRGALAITTDDGTGQKQRLEFERIKGGRARADEIARTIVRQRDYLRRSRAGTSSD